MKHIIILLFSLIYAIPSFAYAWDNVQVAENDQSYSETLTKSHFRRLDTCTSVISIAEVYSSYINYYNRGNITEADLYQFSVAYQHKQEVLSNQSFTKSSYPLYNISATYTYSHLSSDLSMNGFTVSCDRFLKKHFGLGVSLSYSKRTREEVFMPYNVLHNFSYSSFMFGVDCVFPYINNRHVQLASAVRGGYLVAKSHPSSSAISSAPFLTVDPVSFSAGKVLRWKIAPYVGVTGDKLLLGFNTGLALAF